MKSCNTIRRLYIWNIMNNCKRNYVDETGGAFGVRLRKVLKDGCWERLSGWDAQVSCYRPHCWTEACRRLRGAQIICKESNKETTNKQINKNNQQGNYMDQEEGATSLITIKEYIVSLRHMEGELLQERTLYLKLSIHRYYTHVIIHLS